MLETNGRKNSTMKWHINNIFGLDEGLDYEERNFPFVLLLLTCFFPAGWASYLLIYEGKIRSCMQLTISPLDSGILHAIKVYPHFSSISFLTYACYVFI